MRNQLSGFVRLSGKKSFLGGIVGCDLSGHKVLDCRGLKNVSGMQRKSCWSKDPQHEKCLKLTCGGGVGEIWLEGSEEGHSLLCYFEEVWFLQLIPLKSIEGLVKEL